MPLIVFEGISGSGKTTQVLLVLAELEKRKIPYKHFKFPRFDGRRAGKWLQIFLSGIPEYDNKYTNNPDQAFYKNMIDSEDEICQALNAGMMVIIDRYYPSLYAYSQTRGRGFKFSHESFPKIDLLFFLYVHSELALERLEKREAILNPIYNAESFLSQLQWYEHYFYSRKIPAVVVHADDTKNRIHQAIMKEIEEIKN